MGTAMKRCVIVGAAPVADPTSLRDLLRPDDLVIAADGGYDTLRAIGVTPSLLVADFDSATDGGDYPAGIEVVRLPVRKDETDTLAAADMAFERGYREFLLLGCLGGRPDHAMANIQVMARLTARGCRAVIADDRNEITLWEAGSHRLEYRAGYGFSLLAYDPVVTGVTIRRAAYTVENATLTSDVPLGVSNAFLPALPAEISFETGRLLVFCCKE